MCGTLSPSGEATEGHEQSKNTQWEEERRSVCLTLSWSILPCPTVSWIDLHCPVVSYAVPNWPTLSCSVLCCPELTYTVLYYSTLYILKCLILSITSSHLSFLPLRVSLYLQPNQRWMWAWQGGWWGELCGNRSHARDSERKGRVKAHPPQKKQPPINNLRRQSSSKIRDHSNYSYSPTLHLYYTICYFQNYMSYNICTWLVVDDKGCSK